MKECSRGDKHRSRDNSKHRQSTLKVHGLAATIPDANVRRSEARETGIDSRDNRHPRNCTRLKEQGITDDRGC